MPLDAFDRQTIKQLGVVIDNDGIVTARLEKFCYVAVIDGRNFRLGIAERNKPGYFKTDLPACESYAEADQMADKFNAGLGIDDQEANEIVASSMRDDPNKLSHSQLIRIEGLLEAEIEGWIIYPDDPDSQEELEEIKRLADKVELMLKAGR